MDSLEEAPTGRIVIQKVQGRSTVTSLYARYPLKFIHPTKATSQEVDAVWIYTVSFGGGILSGDKVFYTITVGNGCTAVLTTQASTKVYKAAVGNISEQKLDASVGNDSLLAILPDPVTCFSAARYLQKQILNLAVDSNLILVDWLTSGRHKTGEVWDFELYKSTNNIYVDGKRPLFLDSTSLEQDSCFSVGDRMQGFNVIAMLIMFGPKLKKAQDKIQAKIRENNSESSYGVINSSNHFKKAKYEFSNKGSGATLLASCSVFGPMDNGLVVRIVAANTDSVYTFLRNHLVSIFPLIGAYPYSG